MPDIAAGNPNLRPYGWINSENRQSLLKSKNQPMQKYRASLLSIIRVILNMNTKMMIVSSHTNNTPTTDLRFSHFTENYLTDERDPIAYFQSIHYDQH